MLSKCPASWGTSACQPICKVLYQRSCGRIAPSKYKQSIWYLHESASESLDVKKVGKAKSEGKTKTRKKTLFVDATTGLSKCVKSGSAEAPSTVATLNTVVRPLWSPGRDAGNAQRSIACRGGGLKWLMVWGCLTVPKRGTVVCTSHANTGKIRRICSSVTGWQQVAAPVRYPNDKVWQRGDVRSFTWNWC